MDRKLTSSFQDDPRRRKHHAPAATKLQKSGDSGRKIIKIGDNDLVILDQNDVKPVVKGRDAKKQYRGNLVKTYRIFQMIRARIRPDHVPAMKRTPFYHFWLPFLNGKVEFQNLSKSDVVLRKLIYRYSARDSGFRFGSKVLKLTPHDVDLVFGIRSSTREIGLENSSPKPDSDFGRRRAPLTKKDNMEVSEIKREIGFLVDRRDPVAIEDFIKLLCAHSLFTVFDSTSGIIVPNWILSTVDNLEGLSNIAWNKYIAKKLNTSLKHHHLVPENTIGCVFLLGYLLLEHSDLVEPVEPDSIPRFEKWKMLDLKEEFMDLDDSIISKKIQVAPLELTASEIELYGIGSSNNIPGLAVTNPTVGFKSGEISYPNQVSGRRSMLVSDATLPVTLEELRNEFIVMRNENKRLCVDIAELTKRYDAAENRYYNELALRKEVETCLEDSLVEAEVHSITQAISEDKTLSALKDEIAAKDQIIADMRDQIRARDLDRELNNVSPHYSATRVSNVADHFGGASDMKLACTPVSQKIPTHPSDVANYVESGSTSKQVDSTKRIQVGAHPYISSSDALTVQPLSAIGPRAKKRSAGSIERGVKQNPRPRQRNKKYVDAEPVPFAVNTSSSERILADDKGAYEVDNYLTAVDYRILQYSYLADRKELKDVVYTYPRDDHKVIRVEDVYDILTKDKISNAFVECFNELLLDYISTTAFIRKMPSREKNGMKLIGPKIMIMPANTWTYISGGWTGCLHDINDKLDKHAQDPVDHIVVPLNSKGQGNYSYHWTLMVFSVKNKRWDFYTSLALGDLLQDQQRLDAVIVAKYIKAYMQHGQVNRQMTAGIQVNVQSADCPKQEPDQPDCGVIMCYVLKQLIEGKQIVGRMLPYQILNFRANMIHWALNGKI